MPVRHPPFVEYDRAGTALLKYGVTVSLRKLRTRAAMVRFLQTSSQPFDPNLAAREHHVTIAHCHVITCSLDPRLLDCTCSTKGALQLYCKMASRLLRCRRAIGYIRGETTTTLAHLCDINIPASLYLLTTFSPFPLPTTVHLQEPAE